MYELAGDSRAAAYFIALITVGLGGAVGWGLKSLIGPAGQPNNAGELGRKWAGWIILAVCVSLLSKFFGKLDAVSFFKWLAGGGTWVAVAYVLGWVYGKFFKFKSTPTGRLPDVLPTPSATNTPSAAVSSPSAISNNPSQSMQPAHTEVHTEVDENAIYAAIAKELKSGNTDQGLWTRLFAECDGDENRTKVAYIKQRATSLISAKQMELEEAKAEHARKAAERANESIKQEQVRLENKPLIDQLMTGIYTETLVNRLEAISSSPVAELMLTSVVQNRPQEVSRLLADEPLLIGIWNTRGDRPLHIAVRNRNIEMARLLIERGSKVIASSPNWDGVTPLIFATNSGQKEMVKLLT